jgi:hypothetical protein
MTHMTRGGCFGSVLLANELWQSLTAMNGRNVPWVHSCALDSGHDEDHGAPVYQVDGEPQRWIRWPDTGPVRLDVVELSPPGRHSKSLSAAPSPAPASATTPAASPRPVAEDRSPTRGSEADALWAIAAALERLADTVAAYLANPPHDNGLR